MRELPNVTSVSVPPARSRPVCPACGEKCEPTGELLGGYSLFLCRRCGLRSALEALRVPVNYDDAYMTGLYPDQTVEGMRQAEKSGVDASMMQTYAPFFRIMKPVAGRKQLLDVGCGAGRFCRAATRRGWKTVGLDVSEVALEYARALEPLDYRSGVIADIAQAGARFDVITAFEVLEHQPDLRGFLQQIRACLGESGRFLCTVPAWEDPDVRSATRKDWVPPVHLLFFTRRSLRATLTQAGFEVLRTGYIPMAPPGIVPRLKILAKKVLSAPQPPQGIWALARPASVS